MNHLFINFKAYRESTSLSAKNLISRIEENFRDYENIKLVLNPLDSWLSTKMEKYIQHADPVQAGPYTGFLPIELLPSYNYSGVMINHSEHTLPLDIIKKNIEESKKFGLKSLVCAKDIEQVIEFSSFKPDFIAYEPPELIGGEVSVSASKPDIIKKAFDILRGKGIDLIVGAGVKNQDDVRKSVELGAKGVLVASGIVKSKYPITVIREMIEALGD